MSQILFKVSMTLVRLQKYIADQGICSRRKAEDLIVAGKVKVNEKVVKKLGTKVEAGKDKVVVLGKPLTPPCPSPTRGGNLIYIALNKPVDYICSASSKQGQSVVDLITPENNYKNKIKIKQRVYPVGRLDKDSEGLVLLTNDGELTNSLTHPRYGHEKEYEVVIDQRLEREARKVLEKGMNIGGERVRGIKIKKVSTVGKRTIVTVILKEGKKRQIRRMFGRLGYNIISLKRTRIGKLKLGTLPVGRWRLVRRSNII